MDVPGLLSMQPITPDDIMAFTLYMGFAMIPVALFWSYMRR